MYLIEMYSKVRIGKHLSHNFPIQNDIKQGDSLLSLLLKSALEYAIRKVQESQVGMKVNGTHQLFLYADDINLLDDNRYAIRKNIQTLIDASKKVGLEVNTEKTRYMLLIRHQSARQNLDPTIGNGCF
jgi:hypothetical protein